MCGGGRQLINLIIPIAQAHVYACTSEHALVALLTLLVTVENSHQHTAKNTEHTSRATDCV